jgi:small nuclear ribonucleoprotein (snRNP)-like protein
MQKKSFDKTNNAIMKTVLERMRVEETYLIIGKVAYDKHTNIMLNKNDTGAVL